MIANLFPLLRDAAAVTAIIGTDPVRFYPHGSAPQDVIAPYVTHRSISQIPYNALSGTAPADDSRVQLSCWSDNAGTGSAGIVTMYRAVRAAVEAVHLVLAVRDMGRDPITQRYRYDIDVQVIVLRGVDD